MLRPSVILLVVFALFATISIASAQVSIALGNATAGFSQGNGYPVGASIDGVLDMGYNGWGHWTRNTDDASVYETASNASYLSYEFKMTMLCPSHNIGRFRISTTTDDRTLFADGLESDGDIDANWTVLNLTNLISVNGATLTLLDDRSVLASGPNPDWDIYTFSANAVDDDVTGFRLEVLTDSSFTQNGPGRAFNGNFVLTEFEITGIGTYSVPEPGQVASSLILLSGIGIYLWRKRRIADLRLANLKPHLLN